MHVPSGRIFGTFSPYVFLALFHIAYASPLLKLNEMSPGTAAPKMCSPLKGDPLATWLSEMEIMVNKIDFSFDIPPVSGAIGPLYCRDFKVSIQTHMATLIAFLTIHEGGSHPLGLK